MHTWRFINSGFQTGAMNMALDEALLQAVARGDSLPVLRLYRWRPAAVTLGYGQSLVTDVDLAACRRAGLDVVRRSTGGRAVLHDHEVTYAVIAPLNAGLFGGSVLDCYRLIAEVLQLTLGQLGLSAQLVAGKPRGGQQNAMRAVCFSAPSQYELVVEGCKVAGSAQKRLGQAFLQHGSIPLEMNLALLGQVLKADVASAAAEALQTVGWLNRWSSPPLSVAEVAALLAEVFAKQLGIRWLPDEPTVAELRAAKRLCREKFAHPDWNMKR